MNVMDIIQTRRNIKKFKKDSIDRNDILSWLKVATMAPNHRMTEPWEVYFIGPETRAQLNHKTNFGDAPVVFVVLSKHGKNEVEREENRAATACFIQNFMLSAWAEGVGSFWSSIGITPKNRIILSVPEDYDVIGVIGVGYPEEIPDVKPRTMIEEKIKDLP
ncbi:nitroreductase family protein [Neobacillus sp. D3-1R]|uniref:nitroreductase family protein n=1 Tax=Neobacillus sp. D3-1R TaxID=3445778 RepID=UPI003FA03784